LDFIKNKKKIKLKKNKENIISLAKKYTKNGFYIDFPQDIFNSLNLDEAVQIRDDENISRMFKLPKSEIIFFEWLRENDSHVWRDLWSGDEIVKEPYIVSNFLLPALVGESSNGFPICDLETCDNFFFVPDHLADQESKVFLDVAKNKLAEKTQMTIKELLVLEISLLAIDIWHFAYKYKLDLAECKDNVAKLVGDNALVHLKEAEHLSPFVSF
jgi:hypothetical protein